MSDDYLTGDDWAPILIGRRRQAQIMSFVGRGERPQLDEFLQRPRLDAYTPAIPTDARPCGFEMWEMVT